MHWQRSPTKGLESHPTRKQRTRFEKAPVDNVPIEILDEIFAHLRLIPLTLWMGPAPRSFTSSRWRWFAVVGVVQPAQRALFADLSFECVREVTRWLASPRRLGFPPKSVSVKCDNAWHQAAVREACEGLTSLRIEYRIEYDYLLSPSLISSSP